jgi:7-carboxy-7-deazaguanine synthase
MRVHEIFASIQGETSRAGLPTAFVRLSGCNLSCAYCDTRHAAERWRDLDVEEVVAELTALGLGRACVTGGEPLLDPLTPTLVTQLLDRGLEVSLETNGTRPIDAVDARAARVVDVKLAGACPPGGEAEPFDLGILASLTPRDALKFVLTDARDLDEALRFLERHRPERSGAEILFSPCHGRLDAARVSQALVERRLSHVRLNLQLHKIIYGEDARGV